MALKKQVISVFLSTALAIAAWAQQAVVPSEIVEDEITRLCTGEVETEVDIQQGALICTAQQIQQISAEISKLEIEIGNVESQLEDRTSNEILINERLLSVMMISGFSTVVVTGTLMAGSNTKAALQNAYYKFKLKRNRVTEANRIAYERRNAKGGSRLSRMMKTGAITFGLAMLGETINSASKIIVNNDEVEALRSELNLLKNQYTQRKLALLTMQSQQ